MVDPQADDPGTFEPKPIRTASLHSIPLHPKPTNKEAVLSFLSRLSERIESGESPISDLIVVCIEETEFTTQQYVVATDRLSRMEIIGNLHAMATGITVEQD